MELPSCSGFRRIAAILILRSRCSKESILIFIIPNPSEILLLHGHLFLFFRFSLCVAWTPEGFACGWGK